MLTLYKPSFLCFFNVLATHYLFSVSSVSRWMNIFFSLIRFERRTSHISHRHLCSFQLSEDNRKVFNDKRYTANCPIYYCPNCDSSITCWNYDCSTTSSIWGGMTSYLFDYLFEFRMFDNFLFEFRISVLNITVW